MVLDFVFSPEELSKFASDNDAIMDALTQKSREKGYNDALKDVLFGGCLINITKRSIDARRKPEIKIIFKVEVVTQQELDRRYSEMLSNAMPYKNSKRTCKTSPVVVGFGPAGMFAALVLARCGCNPIVLERGSRMDKRIVDINNHETGKSPVLPNSNIQFGEGGAGTFSDGKLFSGISSDLKSFVGYAFVMHGAPDDILYDSQPHIGTDKLRGVVVGIRKEIEQLGGQVIFDACFKSFNTDDEGQIVNLTYSDSEDNDICIECSDIILAPGHSSRDTFRYLFSRGVEMEAKAFSVGVRIEHLKEDIDIAQYGVSRTESKCLSSAAYKLAVDTNSGRKLYTFCMCPGGYVVASASKDGEIVTNGMSDYARDAINSNSAVLVPVDANDYGEGALAGVEYQEMLEHKAYELGGSNGFAPAMRFGDFVSGVPTESFGKVKPSYKPGVTPCDFSSLFTDVINNTLKDGIIKMGMRINGFDSPDAVLTAVESRSSSPLRIVRNKDTMQSVTIRGLYPSGEGAGYAGGIMSSAIDGIRCANALLGKYVK